MMLLSMRYLFTGFAAVLVKTVDGDFVPFAS